MNKAFKKILVQMEGWIDQYEKTNQLVLEKTKIQIMGQFGLLLHPEPRLNKLDLAATRDLDAKITGPYPMMSELKIQLQKIGLVYDTDSEKIWLPKNFTVTNIYQSPKFSVDVVDPVFLLVSKALKAKEKNKKLIQQSLLIFGDELTNLLIKEGVDLAYFQTS